MAHWQSGNGRAQGGDSAQTWSDASCITLTLAHLGLPLQFVVCFHLFSSSCFLLVCLAVRVWSEAWVGWLMGGWGFLINSPGTA